MKKILIFSFVFILLVGIVSASALSTLWKQGVSAANPQAARVISAADSIMEIQSLAQCVTGIGASACMQTIIKQKAMGQVYGEAIKAAGPEVQKIISTYQQLDLYRQAGAELVDLKIDENGEIEEGIIQFSGKEESEIGKLIGPNIKEKIFVKGIEFSKVDGKSTLTITETDNMIQIGDDKFENIQSQEDAKHPTFFELNEEGEIERADFTTNEKGGTYTLGEVSFDVPPSSRVFYDKENGFQLSKGTEIKEIKTSARFSGEEIVLPNGAVMNGRLNYDENGQAFVKIGDEVIIDKTKFLKTNNDVNIYFEKYFDPNKHIGENYYFENDKGFLMNSVEKGKVKVEFLEGNEFFDMNKPEYAKDENGRLIKFISGDEKEGFLKDEYGFKYKVISDEKDLLKITVENGDSLEAKERTERKFLFIGEKKKKIPLLKHSNSENGKTIIENGRSKFLLTDKLNLDTKTFTNQDEFDKIHNGKYQSVAFQLQSDSIPKNYELRIGSNNQFAFISPDEKDTRVVFNKYGIGISKYPEKLQTIDQLNAKYAERGIYFDISPEGIPSLFEDRKIRYKEYQSPSPYMIQLTDQWLKDHPDANLDFITFSSEDNAFYSPISLGLNQEKKLNLQKLLNRDIKGITLGEKIFHKDSDNYFIKTVYSQELDRKNNPYDIITHEYEHLLDDEMSPLKLFSKKSFKKTKMRINNAIMKDASEYAELEFKNVKEESLYDIKSYELFPNNPLDKEAISNFEDNLASLEKELNEGGYDGFIKKYKKSSIPYYGLFSFERELNTKEDVDGYLKEYKLIIEDFNRDTNLKFEYDKRKEIYGTSNKDIIKSLIKETKYTEYLIERAHFIKKENLILEYLDSKLLSDGYGVPQDYYDKIIENGKKRLDNDLVYNKKIVMYSQEITEPVLKLNKKSEKNRKIIMNAYQLLDNIENKREINPMELKVVLLGLGEYDKKFYDMYKDLSDHVTKTSGLPAVYAFNPGNHELSSTYREESIEERKQKLHDGTPAEKEVYYQMTQLCFDSGKCPSKEYKQLMGNNYCEELDCCDRKCVIYKLNCEGGC